MNHKQLHFIGLLGVIIFITTSIIGGLLIENYSSVKQFISETYAIDTEYGLYLRLIGFIPSGVLITLFFFFTARLNKFNLWTKIGFYSVAIFYGIATIMVSIFPCDSGCNIEMIDPSTSQLIHNIIGFMTYVFVPISILVIGFNLQSSRLSKLSKQSKFIGGLSAVLVIIFLVNSNSNYAGLYQRLVEASFLFWIVLCANAIKHTNETTIEN